MHECIRQQLVGAQWNHKQPVSGKHTTLAAGIDPFFKMATLEFPSCLSDLW